MYRAICLGLQTVWFGFEGSHKSTRRFLDWHHTEGPQRTYIAVHRLRGLDRWLFLCVHLNVYRCIFYITLSFWLANRHLIKINIMKPRLNTSWDVATGDIAWRWVIFQKLSTAQNLCAYGSPYILTGVVWAFEYTEYEIQRQIFTWPGLFWNVTLSRSQYLYNINLI